MKRFASILLLLFAFIFMATPSAAKVDWKNVANKTLPIVGTAMDRGGAKTVGNPGVEVAKSFLGPDKTVAVLIKDLFDDLLAAYKDEGRAYARELGDNLAERACANPKIASTLTSVQVLCWGVVVYLTLVTIYLVFTVNRLRRANRRLMEIVEDQIRRNGK